MTTTTTREQTTRVALAPFRELFDYQAKHYGRTLSDVATWAGLDFSRTARLLGFQRETPRSKRLRSPKAQLIGLRKRYPAVWRTSCTEEVALQLCEGLHCDPVDVGF
jgi:hypothetical protein